MLDVIHDIRSCLGSRLVLSPIHPLPFEDAEETFRRGIVCTTPHRAHATDHLMGGQKLLVFLRGKLAALIRMQNDRHTGGPLPNGHQDRLDDDLTVLPRTHRPAHHQARIQIQHDTQIQPVFGGPHIRDIGHPFGVGGCGREVSLQMIARASRRGP